MRSGTERLEGIVEEIESLVSDAREGRVHLRNAGRIGCYGVVLRSILKAEEQASAAAAARAARPGGLDHSVPAGDRW
jgi:hypothetical protein